MEVLKKNLTRYSLRHLHEEVTDRRRTKFSTLFSGSNEKSLTELKLSPISKTLEAIRKLKVAPTSGNLHETQEKLNQAIRNDSLTSEKRSKLDTDVHTLDTVVAKVQDASSNNESQVKDGSSAGDQTNSSLDKAKNEPPPVKGRSSAGDQTNSSSAKVRNEPPPVKGVSPDGDSPDTDVANNELEVQDISSAGEQPNSKSDFTLSGKEKGGSNSSERPSKHVDQARMILLAVLKEIMEWEDEKDRFRRIEQAFHLFSKRPFGLDETRLISDLGWYFCQRRTAWNSRYLFDEHLQESLEYEIWLQYESIVRTIIKGLFATVASLDFDEILKTWVFFKNSYVRYLLDNNEEDIEDDGSRRFFSILKEFTEKLWLTSRDAFEMLLTYVKLHAGQEKFDEYKEELRVWPAKM